MAIFESMSDANRYHLDDAGARRGWPSVIDAEPRTRGFGNARFVRNVFEAAVGRQAERLASVEHPTDEQLTTLTADDIVAPDPPERAASDVSQRHPRVCRRSGLAPWTRCRTLGRRSGRRRLRRGGRRGRLRCSRSLGQQRAGLLGHRR